MRIAGLDSIPGARVYGLASAGRTLAQMPVDVPVNLLEGAHAGPVLAVTCGVHGAELIGTLAVLDVLRDLDLSRMRGVLIAVPVANTSGFEFGTRHVYWDGKILNRVGGGRPDGTYTERLAHLLYHEIVARADAWIDIHSGTPETYMWYTIAKGGPPGTATAVRALEMAKAFGLADIAVETPWKDASLDLGVPAITPEIGGGPDFLRGGQTQVETGARGIRNVMRLLGMIDGPIEGGPRRYRLWRIHTDISNGPVGGILSMRVKRGDVLEPGETFGVILHPFNGQELARITSPARGTLVDSGVVWPVVRAGQWLAALGDVVDEIEADWEA
ncbi:MAG: succinylglutamate desuccinylase/aspartoacylase family protein [Armatimonadota bacterium]|nr:succinylglutamate desuccinylase/aspartoacylase family protein [Armatimonadota bacterium]